MAKLTELIRVASPPVLTISASAAEAESTSLIFTVIALLAR